MPALNIPQLRSKLQFLITYGHVSNWYEIGNALDRSPKTVKWWADGSAVRKPGNIPSTSADKLIQFVADALPPPNDVSTARRLLLGSIDEFEAALRGAATVTLTRLVEQHGDWNLGTLVRSGSSSIALIETDRQPQTVAPFQVKLGEWFRVFFKTALDSTHVVALQHVQQSWGLVPHYFDPDLMQIHLPDREDDGRYVHMREQRDADANIFVAMQTLKPIPHEIQQGISENISLDRSLCSQLVSFYEQQPSAKRCLFAMRVKISLS